MDRVSVLNFDMSMAKYVDKEKLVNLLDVVHEHENLGVLLDRLSGSYL